MIRLFGKIFALYCVLVTVGIFAIVFAPNSQIESPITYILTLAEIMLWSFIAFRVCGWLAARRFNKKIVSIVEEECDPVRFIAALMQLLQKTRPKTHIRASLQLDLSMGLIQNGRFDEALALLRTVFIGRGRAGFMERAAYFNNLCAAFLEAGDLDNARCALDDLARLYNEGKVPQKFQAVLYSRCQRMRLLLQMGRSNFDGVQLYFSEEFQTAQNRQGKVTAQYRLAQTYEHEGKTDKAREAYLYVAENGNTLWVARQAREMLKK